MRCLRREARRERTPPGGGWQTREEASHAGMIPLWSAPSILACPGGLVGCLCPSAESKAWCPCCSGQVNLRCFVVGRALTRFIDNLGTLRRVTMLKAWHVCKSRCSMGSGPLLVI
jgi:hypothetical protein